MAKYFNLLSLALVILCRYIFQTAHSNNHKHNGFSFRLINRNSLISSSDQPTNLSVEEHLERLLYLSDEPRVKYLEQLDNSVSSSQSMNKRVIIRAPLVNQPGLNPFLVEVGIGTFSGGTSHNHKTYYLILETASHITWTQCEGCDPCFPQRDPYFPRSSSSTYKALPCNQCPEDTICQHGHCTVENTYPDGSHIQGIAATETFTLPTNVPGQFTPVPNTSFSCVISTRDFIAGMTPDNIASGVIGMNRHHTSFLSQMGMQNTGGRFSYCLTPIEYPNERPALFLRFGADIPSNPSPYRVQQTPFIQGRENYYINLQDISVGSTRLNLDPYVLRGSSGGCLVDTGTIATRLINTAFEQFERVLTRRVKAMNQGTITKTTNDSKLCYHHQRMSGETTTVFPTITFHFANDANFMVPPIGYIYGFWKGNDNQRYCLTIRPSNTSTILGIYQQVSKRIIYDIANSQFSFIPTNCLDNN